MPTLTTIRRDAAELPSVALSLIGPNGRTEEARVGLTAIVVGSGAECEVTTIDPRVSRRHCEVRLTAEGLVLRDLGSKNGTFIGRIRVGEATLPLGETVVLGDSRLSARIVGAPDVVPLSVGARFGEALGGSVPMRALFAKLHQAAATRETLLLLGESGTGKELLARAVHDASPRSGRPFVIFDCSAVAPSLMEAELFGYERGAFTGAVGPRAGLLEEVGGGTLFVDEIGELPLELQPKLLRALESRQSRRLGSTEWRGFDARIVAATHRDLRARLADGQFREDLYYRLSVLALRIPPLRERKEDIPLLVERLLAGLSPPRSIDDLPPNAMQLLADHDWPGNVRELRNTVARLVVFPGDVHEAIAAASGGASSADPKALLRLPLREAREIALETFERAYLKSKLDEHAGNVNRAATAMGVSRQLVYRMIDRYGLRRDDE